MSLPGGKLTTSLVVVAVLLGGGAVAAWRLGAGPWAGASTTGGGASPGSPGSAGSAGSAGAHVPAMTVEAVTPANGASGVTGTSPVQVRFSDRLDAASPDPTLSPAMPGQWQRTDAHTLTFTPTEAYLPGASVSVTVAAGRSGPRALDGAHLASPVTASFTVAPGSTERLQQLLSLLQYSPLTWTPQSAPIAPTDAAAQRAALFAPPAGTFAWGQSTWPAQLTGQWQEGADNVFTQGLIMEFQADHGLNVDGTVTPQLWADLLSALAAGTTNTGGYNYALASKTAPESLTVWHDGQVAVQTPVNTGIAQDATPDGTFPVYERLRNQVMQGTNPDGSHYADPVQYVAYFHGGDAVHYMPRANYGTPASLGCIELPLAQAAQVWPYLAYGTLVTVVG